MNELISVIITVYKVEKYLDRCIDSVLRQSYVNLEIILVNDGSPDRCGDICHQYESLDQRVVVIDKKNGGLSDARNVGIQVAKGKYITFIDGDDWVHHEYIEKLYRLLKLTNANISMCDFVRTSEDHVDIASYSKKIHEFTNLEALHELAGSLSVTMAISCGKLYEKSLFEGIQFPVGKIHEDEFTTYKLIHRANKVVYTNEQLLYYWQRNNSIMGVGFNLKSRLHIIEAYHERITYYEDIGEAELAAKTMRTLFSFYKSINDNIVMLENENERDIFFSQFIEMRTKLRDSRQDITFKLYYELYYIMPKVTKQMHKIYKYLACEVLR